ncbi:hypothetical protein K461DRAFT_316885 [Myriangium duriaei CBS 260.36]|uniref:DNA (cytosine-5)-methyltransferase 1 replication foci domain-containing protein n=1 Tax=Myriangium duriaei CBS 260.36 TaxID=1168546 RepID=A0A9P4JD47_9PEZI|nr:hypothetical protein K461DRAFT_316885 [Myriangium duriaei CBS 260.36]
MDFYPEADLLRPVDPTQHSDDWPILELSGCGIYAQTDGSGDGGSPVNPDLSRGLISLLEADVRNPLVIRGKLNSVPRELNHLWVQQRSGAVPLQLDNVRQYAYGQYEDGRVELWAAGTAAWYVIRPSRGYRAIYERMIEAVDLLYFCADVYGNHGTKSRKGKGKQNVTADNCFARYATIHNTIFEGAVEAFERHARFLISSMMGGKENIDWTKTDIWNRLTETYPELHKELIEAKKRLAEPAAKAGTKRKRSTAQSAGRSVRSVSAQNVPTVKSTRANSSSKRSQVQPSTPRTSTPLDDSDEDSAASGKRPRARKGKSTLRPRTSKYVAIEATGSPDSDVQASEQPSRPSSRNRDPSSPLAPPVRPLPSRRSRRGHPIDTPNAMASAEPVDEGIDMSLDHSQDSESDVQSDIIVPPIGGIGKTIAVRLREEHVAATSEGDVWTCPLDGCLHRIFAASEPESQKLVKEHYRRHVNDEDAEMRLELVRKMTAPGLRVDRLMSRIQAFGGQKSFPTPVVQRF